MCTSRKYIIQKFFDSSQRAKRSINRRTASRHVSSEGSQMAPGLRTCSVSKHTSKKQDSENVSVSTWCQSEKLSLSLSLSYSLYLSLSLTHSHHDVSNEGQRRVYFYKKKSVVALVLCWTADMYQLFQCFYEFFKVVNLHKIQSNVTVC